jgi:hypothetical protein
VEILNLKLKFLIILVILNILIINLFSVIEAESLDEFNSQIERSSDYSPTNSLIESLSDIISSNRQNNRAKSSLIKSIINNSLFKPKNEIYSKDIQYFFPIYENGIYFLNKSIILEIIEYDENTSNSFYDCYEIEFPRNFSILKTNSTTITYGVANEIEVSFRHSNLGKLKADYTIYNKKWLLIEYNLKSVNNKVVKKKGASLSTLDLEKKPINNVLDKSFKFENGEKQFKILAPDKGVIHKFENNKYILKLPDSVDYPFTFDPTIQIDVRFRQHSRSNRLGCFSNGTIVTTFTDNSGTLYLATSEDGVIFDVSPVVPDASTSMFSGNCFTIMRNDTIWLLYVSKDGGLCHLSKPSDGPWSGIKIIKDFTRYSIKQPDCALTSTGAVNIVWCNIYSGKVKFASSADDFTTLETVHYNPGDYRYSARIVVNNTDTSHIMWIRIGLGTNYVKYCTRDRTGAYGLIRTIATDYKDPHSYRNGDICIDDINFPERVYVTYVAKNDVYEGTHNIIVAYRTNGNFKNYQYISNEAINQQHGSRLSKDSSGNMWCFWNGFGWGVNKGYHNVVCRKLELSTGNWTPPLEEDPTLVVDSPYDKKSVIIFFELQHRIFEGMGTTYVKMKVEGDTRMDYVYDGSMVKKMMPDNHYRYNDLTEVVKRLDLSIGVKNSLVTKLEISYSMWEKNRNTSAKNMLIAFKNEVGAQMDKKITLDQAYEIISNVEEIYISLD